MYSLRQTSRHNITHLISLGLLVVLLFSSVASVYAAGATDGALLVIPSLKLRAPIIESYKITGPDGTYTWDVSDLGARIGHLEHTAWLNNPGRNNHNIVLAGHSTSAFARLHLINHGAVIVIQQGGIDYRYSVTEIKLVSPADISVVYGTSEAI